MGQALSEEEIRRAMDGAESFVEGARRLGISAGYLSRRARALGIYGEVAPPGTGSSRFKEVALEVYKEGSVIKASESLGCSRAAIYKTLGRHGMTPSKLSGMDLAEVQAL